jgi:GT2 family glycosyltransferase
LYHVAKVIVRHPGIMLIYSDEDKVDIDGQRHDPYFKPDWNPDLIYSHNLFSHLGVYKYSLMKDVGGFRLGFEGSQDYDLLLRCLEKINPSEIFHIPYVLYHWRVHANSTAMVDSDAKPYAMIAGERAINEHLSRQSIKGHVELIGFGYRQHYELPHSKPSVSIIIPTRNSIAVVQNCIDSIRRLTTYKSYEILLIDNGSDEPDSLKGFEALATTGVRVLKYDGEFNYSAINNYAVLHATGELIALVNNDVEVLEPNWLGIMVGFALQKNVGAVGARLFFPNSTVQHAGVVMGLGGVAGHAHYRCPDKATGYFGRLALTSTFSAVSAACLVVRRDLYLKVGGLDEINLTVAFNDVDFCLKLNDMGFRSIYAADAVLLHYESLTRGADSDSKNRIRFTREASFMRRKWGHVIKNDPCYSPNLSLDSANFSLAWPPRLASYLKADSEI